MAITLLETFETLVHSEFIRTTARQLGESEDAVAAAIAGAGSAILARIVELTSDLSLMTRIAALLGPRAEGGGATRTSIVAASTGPQSASASQLGRGTALLNMTFGPRLQELVDALARHSGITQASSRAAIGHAAPLVLKAMSERLEEAGLATTSLAPTGAQLADMLLKERDAILRNVPLALMTALDRPTVRPMSPAVASPTIRPTPMITVRAPPAATVQPSVTASAAAAARTAQSVSPRPAVADPAPALRETESPMIRTTPVATAAPSIAGGAGIVDADRDDDSTLGTPTLIGGLVGLALLWWLFLPGFSAPYSVRTTPSADSFRPSPDRRTAETPPRPSAQAAGGSFSGTVSTTPSTRDLPAPVSGLMRFIKRTLPSNKQIDFAEEGIEGRLIALIENRNLPLSRTQWFEFDRLQFHTGSSNLTAESRAQVQNIADILASYPQVRIKIGGYTDNIGDPTANQRLSEARAQRVMTELITLGINALRLEAEGYGDQHAIADNGTAEGRARNRRIAVRITER